jgi:hypothetical protein
MAGERAMNGPADGPEEREADLADYFDREYENIERIEFHEEDQIDESLLEQAKMRMNQFFLDKLP